MKKIKCTKVLAVLLASAMALSLAACDGSVASSGDSSKTSSQDSAAETSKLSDSEDGPLTPYEEPITITWAVPTSAVQKFRGSDTYEDNLWSRKIKEELNIDVKVAFSADSSTDAFKNKINAMLASGDLPDIIHWHDRSFFEQAQGAGYLADISDVFDQYATDALKEYQVKYPECFEGASKDERLYAFPYITDNFHDCVYLWIRDDWLENTNSEPPATLEEMLELARKFTFEDPDGNGIDDTYGLGLQNRVAEATYGNLLGIASAFGLPARGYNGSFYRRDDGKITYPYIEPEMKEVLEIARDLYAEGVIDPEFIVKDNPKIEEDVAKGKLGMMYHFSYGDWLPFNLSYEADGVITRPYPIPVKEGVDYKIGIESNKTGDLFMLNANYEHPEAFIKILNLYNKTCVESTDPEDFSTYWADEQYRFCPAFVGIPTPELFVDELTDALEKGSGEDLPANLQTVYGYIVDFESGANTDANAYGTWGQVSSRGSVVIAKTDYKGHQVPNILANERPEIWTQNSSVLQTVVDMAFTDIITGKKPLDSFDQFVQDWLNAGGQQTLDELEKLYPDD